MPNGNKLLTSENAGKMTLLGFAMFLVVGAYNMFTASGWKLGNEFYGGVILCAIAGAVLLVREYLKRKYPGTEPAIDLTEAEKVIDQLHDYRDFVKEHADVEIAMANMSIEIAKAAGLPQAQIDKMVALRDKWRAMLDIL